MNNDLVFPNIVLQPKVKGVLIDIDKTLYPYEPAHQKAIKACYDEFMKTFSVKSSFDDFNKKYRNKRTEVTKRLLPQGACRSRLFAFQKLFEEINVHHAFNHALTFEKLYWDNLIQNMERSKNAYQFLLSCKNKNIPVCAVSDMQAHFQIQKLQKMKMDHLIDYVVTSEEVGAEKPSPIMFETALKKLCLEAKDVIMIGDNQSKDIDGAKALGITGYKVELKND